MFFPFTRHKRVATLAGASALVAGLVGTVALGSGAADAGTRYGIGSAVSQLRGKALKTVAGRPIVTIPARANRSAVLRDRNTGAVIRQSKAADWKLTFADNFSASKLHKNWSVYNGVPGGDPAGQFAGSHLKVSGGLLHLQGYRDSRYQNKFTTAGVSAQRGGLAQRYGKYEVRMRADHGKGVSYVALLYPMVGWPPEIDFAEDNGATRRSDMLTTQHWGTKHKRGKAYRRAKVDMSKWHTVGVEWRPNQLTYTLDGKPWAQVVNSNVPKVPMRLALQTQAWDCGHTWVQCPDRTTPKRVDMQVDWVRIYKLV